MTLQNNKTQYLDLVPYGCTELRLTVFPDADAQPLPDPQKPDYTRPADAPDCVSVVCDADYVYFEEPRFCWDEPIYCKVRTAGDTTTDLQSPEGGDLCEMVGTTANGRKIWRWIGVPATEQPFVELVFTNHDLLTEVMPFACGGYYRYDRLVYLAYESVPTSITKPAADKTLSADWFTLDGRRLQYRPTTKGIFIHHNKKIVL